MKLASRTLRTFTALHTWTGLVAGFALFVAFYAGALTVFHHDLQAWESPGTMRAAPETLDDAQRLLDATLARHPAARVHVGMVFPGGEYPVASSYWQDESGTWRFATLQDLEGSDKPFGGTLSELVNLLHYSLGIPVAGTWLMGVVSLLYGLALLSGLVIHLPKLLGDLFALRPGRNLKRFWQDAHNVVGVLSLPMHIMFAVTGALLCLAFVTLMALDPLVYRGGGMQAVPAAMDTAPLVEPDGTPAAPAPLARMVDIATATARAHGLDAFEPAYLKLAHGGDARATLEITGESPGSLGPLGTVALDAHTGEVLATQLPGTRDANHATLAAAYALHFGEFGNAGVAWLYFLLGLGGAFLFYSGNLLWIESRRKRRQVEQGRAPQGMARATVGVCLGVCVAISAAFVATQLLQWPALGFRGELESGVRLACFGTWAACAAWAALRPPARAARELLAAAAITTALVPLAHGLATGAWFWRAAAAGHWNLFAIDAGALALAFGFAWLARLSARRARSGDPHSVWADPSVQARGA
ncbi:PepSY-associated TM helix domain-containing protein [Marilutibacter aestuarii]|uniref:PepSY domain-containing protein n=1 Tax=Marilutibacter aestuarii TaxID=1706195 RepID=A0A507ZNT3_9GAMM|nr:PepSY-associated TM helix domain-containing protein [Lysobacter aestuarii]TQD39190.1 PepSY domain-containing protein [Lysobacter aestuarii]